MNKVIMSAMGIMLLAGCGGTAVLTVMPDPYYTEDYEEIYVDEGGYYESYYDAYDVDSCDPLYLVDEVDYVYEDTYYDDEYYEDEYYYDDESYGDEY